MPSLTVNICVFTLVLLSFQQICHCRPQRIKRGLVKDYFVPDTLVFASDKFEKGEDGKFHLKKSAHKPDSEVDYMSADNAERKNDIVPNISEIDSVKEESKATETAGIKTDPNVKELLEKETELVSRSANEEKSVAEKVDSKDGKAPFIPKDTKFTVPPKPDAKDEVAFKTDLPQTESEGKEEEKVLIGEVPDLPTRLVPVPENIRIPILIPIRQISYRAMKIIPIPPADVSDRLPIPYEDDIIGEGAHESESEEVSQPLAEKEKGYALGNPLMSLLSFHNMLKELKEADKENVEKESKVVDVLGKKFLMESNVMKYPSKENSHTFIRFLSMKPLDEVIPTEPKEVVPSEEILKKDLNVEERKSIEVGKELTAEENEKVKAEKDMKESEVKKDADEKLQKEADILKAEETELKMKIEKNVPKEILKNMDEEEAEDKIKSAATDVKSIEEISKDTIEHKLLQPEMKDVDLKVTMESKEMGMKEKVESQLQVKESKDSESKKEESGEKQESGMLEDEIKSKSDSVLNKVKDRKANDKKMEEAEHFMKKHEVKKMEMGSKKDLFLLEKKKKEKSKEEIEDVKYKNKTENKKKKCKCEEKDSDSEDESDE